MLKVPVHVEVEIKQECRLSIADIVENVSNNLREKCPIFQNGVVHQLSESFANSVTIADLLEGQSVSYWQAELCVHAHKLSEQSHESDYIEGEDELPACEQWELPNIFLKGLWDSIVIDDVIKNRLLSYCNSSVQFSEAGIDTNIISWNRMILLHGPPGTGKTTMCKALAQKLYIRNSSRYTSGMLLEVNSHSLFSKWFSESGKLVMKLFAHIKELAEDTSCLVVVLIDEVESITSARSSSGRSNEPGDAVRVVNAVLTSLDGLRRLPNVLLLCTSNLVDSVDAAFIDRIDMKVYIGPPPLRARFAILQSCLVEIMDKHIISPSVPFSCTFEDIANKFEPHIQSHRTCVEATADPSESFFRSFEVPSFDLLRHTTSEPTGPSIAISMPSTRQLSFEEHLFVVAGLCVGMSGRAMRKLPLRAHAYYLQRPSVKVEEFVAALHAIVALKGEEGE